MSFRLKTTDCNILECLAEYRILTVSQVAAIFHKSRQVTRRRLHDLEEGGLIEVVGAEFGRGRGRPENSLGLAERGIAVLQNCWQISADTVALLKKEHQGNRHRISTRTIKLSDVHRYVAVLAVAACLIIAVLIGLLSSKREAVLTGPNHSVALTNESSPLVIKLADCGHIAPGAMIQTSAGEIENLVINGRHRVVMNTNTKLSIQSHWKAGDAGCLMNLAFGEVYVHVEHDGHPFIVQTAHGRAVVTGTTFDVKATDTSTALVVVEGSVRLESESREIIVLTS
jgi:hypothetical protein